MSTLVPVAHQERPVIVNTSGASTDVGLIDVWLRGHRSRNTRIAYGDDIVKFFDFLYELPREPEDYQVPPRVYRLAAVTVRHVQAFAEHLERAQAAPSTLARRLSAVKSLLTFAQRTGYIPFNVGSAVKRPHVRQEVAQKLLTREQLTKVFEVCSAGRDSALLRLLYVSGLRISEAISLRIQDIHVREDRVVLDVVGKGGKQRMVAVPLSLHAHLLPLLSESSEWLFPGNNEQHLSRSLASKIVKRAGKRAGVPWLTPHCLRHTHASHAIRAGAPIHVVQQTLGHASVSTTGLYLHIEQGESSATYLEAI